MPKKVTEYKFLPVIEINSLLPKSLFTLKKSIKVKKSPSHSKDEEKYLKMVGERLRFYRLKAGYTNYEYFAYDNGINRPQYGKYEAGANIQLNTLMKILKALNVSLEEFFHGFK